MISTQRKQKNSASASAQKHSHISQETNVDMVKSVVKGVSKLNLRLPSVSASKPIADFYYIEIGNDDGSCTTETASSRSSLSSSSSLTSRTTPLLCCPGQSLVRLPSLNASSSGHGGVDWGITSCVGGGGGGLHQWSSHPPKQEPKIPEKHHPKLLSSLKQEKTNQLELKDLWEQQQRQQRNSEYASVTSTTSTTAGTTISGDPSSIRRQEEESSRANDSHCRDDNGEDEEDSGAHVVDIDEDDDEEEIFGPMEAGYHHQPSSDNGKDVDIHYPQQQADDYEDPPLSAQTSYARQQLLKSSRYQELQRLAKAQRKAQGDDDSVDSDDYYYCVDEVEMSRELGGYEEGFAVPSLGSCHHGYHHLPLSIMEEQDDISLSSSVANDDRIMDDFYDGNVAVAGKSGSLGNTAEETITVGEEYLGGSRFLI